MSTKEFLTSNSVSVQLTEVQVAFVEKAVEMYPDIKESETISRKEAFEVYKALGKGHPKWLKNKGLQATRGNYYLPHIEITKSSEEGDATKNEVPEDTEDEKVTNTPDDFEAELAANGIEV